MPAQWSFLTNHARALVCIAHDEDLRLGDIADVLAVTERTVFGIVTDLTDAGYVVKEKDGRRNRYRIQHHLPLRQAIGREPTIGELLGLLVDATPMDTAPMETAPVDTAPVQAPRMDAAPVETAPMETADLSHQGATPKKRAPRGSRAEPASPSVSAPAKRRETRQ
jgi:DNA-binding transcriptional ArsR family regulator